LFEAGRRRATIFGATKGPSRGIDAMTTLPIDALPFNVPGTTTPKVSTPPEFDFNRLRPFVET
jgi:hypothetical protein